MNRKTILYVPDFESRNTPEVAKALREAFPEWKVAGVEIDINAYEETKQNLGKYIHLYRPDILISEGLGGYFVHQWAGYNRICVSTDLHPSFRCDNSLVEMYTEKETKMAYDCTYDHAKNTHCWGVFGKDADKREFYMAHYPNVVNVPRKVSSV